MKLKKAYICTHFEKLSIINCQLSIVFASLAQLVEQFIRNE